MNDFLYPFTQTNNQYKSFFIESLAPHAQEFDRLQKIPRSFFMALGNQGFLGANIPKQYGGLGLNYGELALLHEAAGSVLPSVENILTVYGMFCKALIHFGTKQQRENWLPKIARGETIVSIALTEPNVGSDLAAVECNLVAKEDYFLLSGRKKYITLGQIANLFLVLAKFEEKPVALLIEKETPGLSINPITDILGLRSNMLAEIVFEQCEIPNTHILGNIGVGLSQVAAISLDEGRFTTAWGCIGIGQACFELAQSYAHKRIQGGMKLAQHQLIQKILTEIISYLSAARALCLQTAHLRDNRDISYISQTLISKYFAAKMAVLVAKDALDIFGGIGFTKEFTIERFYRDAKIMEVIEGTSQIHEINIPKTL